LESVTQKEEHYVSEGDWDMSGRVRSEDDKGMVKVTSHNVSSKFIQDEGDNVSLATSNF
jgi:hypothetical protein